MAELFHKPGAGEMTFPQAADSSSFSFSSSNSFGFDYEDEDEDGEEQSPHDHTGGTRVPLRFHLWNSTVPGL